METEIRYLGDMKMVLYDKVWAGTAPMGDYSSFYRAMLNKVKKG